MRFFSVLILLCAFLASCTKTSEKQCSMPVNRVPAYLWFEGYTPNDLTTIYINRYSDYAFTQLKGSDTLNTAGYPTAPLDMTTSYEVVLPNVGRTYRIEKIVYHNTDSTFEYITYGNCDHTLTVAPDSFYLNNVKMPLRIVSSDQHYVVLHK